MIVAYHPDYVQNVMKGVELIFMIFLLVFMLRQYGERFCTTGRVIDDLFGRKNPLVVRRDSQAWMRLA